VEEDAKFAFLSPTHLGIFICLAKHDLHGVTQHWSANTLTEWVRCNYTFGMERMLEDYRGIHGHRSFQAQTIFLSPFIRHYVLGSIGSQPAGYQGCCMFVRSPHRPFTSRGVLYEGLDRQLVTIQARLPKGYKAAPGRRRL
jgi:hypothetical protein